MKKKTEKEKAKIIAFSIAGEILEKMDKKVDEMMIPRSRFIVEAIKKYMEKQK